MHLLLLSVISSSPNLANRLFHLNIEGFFSLHFKTLSLVGAQYLFCDPVITATMCARAMMACPVGLYAGPALMAVWSKAPPLTARCLSPLPWVQIPAWIFEKVASNFGLGGDLRRILWFSPLLTTG